MKKQISCIHYAKMVKSRQGGYSYSLIGAELNLCKNCERKLREQIIEQKRIEEKGNK